jgi:adenosylcobinamide-phosphate synthase
VLDLLLGDPYWLPHPVRLMGNIIAFLEKRWNIREISNKKKIYRGAWMVLLLLFGTLAASIMIIFAAYCICPWLGMAVESIMTYQILATKCLKTESMKVYRELKKNNLPGARKAVSMIVGRDTELLDEVGVAKAAVETVAENTSDGVIAPMLYLALGGPVLGFFYKAINTMDSMVGYKNERYLYFGRAAAQLDDVANYLPSRISAGLMIAASYVLGALPIWMEARHKGDTAEEAESIQKRQHVFQGARAVRIYRRDRRKHASPNSAQTESVCAGSLGIRLAGNASYFGKITEKPFIGDADRKIEPEDIPRANLLLYTTAWICEMMCLLILELISAI